MRFVAHCLIALTFILASIILSGRNVVFAQVTIDPADGGTLQLNYEANNPTKGATSTGLATYNYTAGSLTTAAVPGSVNNINNSAMLFATQVTSTYAFNGTGGSDNTDYNSLGSFDNDDGSFEFWFRPTDLSTNTTRNQILFETGGDGNGVSLALNYDDTPGAGGSPIGSPNITYTAQTGAANAMQITVPLTAGVDDARFNQFVAVMDEASGAGGELTVYYNGVALPSVTSGTFNDWDGGDDRGFGEEGGVSVAGLPNTNDPSPNDYDGDIAVQRFYNSRLTATEVTNNFNALSAGLQIDQAFNETLAVSGNDPLPINVIASPDTSDAGNLIHGTVDLGSESGIVSISNPSSALNSELVVLGLRLTDGMGNDSPFFDINPADAAALLATEIAASDPAFDLGIEFDNASAQVGTTYFAELELYTNLNGFLNLDGTGYTNPPGVGSDAFGTFDDLAGIFRFQIQALAVPEPTSVALWAIMGMVAVGFGYRRYRTQAN